MIDAATARFYAESPPSQPIEDDVLERIQKYDPDQPRDEDGKWTDGGTSVSFSDDPKVAFNQAHDVLIGIVKKHFGMPNMPDTDAESWLRLGWLTYNDAFLSETGYRITSVNFEEKEAILVRDTSKEDMIAHGKETAEKLGWPLERLKFTNEDYSFELNGKQYKAAGTAHLDINAPEGRYITMYSNQLRGDTIDNVLAHEVGHMKYQTAWDNYERERVQVMKELDDTPYANRWNTFMHASGELFDEHKAKYPIFTKWFDTWESKGQQLQKEDGVTDYSRDWWKAYENHTATQHQAIHETIAEMNAIYVTTGKLPGAKVWKDFYKVVDETQFLPKGRGKFRSAKV